MIHFIVGTKAQLIKIAPVMLALRNNKVPYSFVSFGQHKETIDDILRNFDLSPPDVRIYDGPDITSVLQMLKWGALVIAKSVLRKKQIFGQHPSNILVVHGDTFSAVLGALIGKLLRFRVAHVESGLRSFDFKNPFPEELFRVAVFCLTDVYYCPGEIEYKNLKRFKGEKIITRGNTIVDAAQKAMESQPETTGPSSYCVASLHRVENFSSLAASQRIVNLLEIVASSCQVVFVLHKITEKALIRFGLYERLRANPRIEIRPRTDYFSFIRLLRGSRFVVSDGGSNQEECSYMGIPTILLRKATERHDGLDSSVVLSNYDVSVIEAFLRNVETFRRPTRVLSDSPAQIIANHLRMVDLS